MSTRNAPSDDYSNDNFNDLIQEANDEAEAALVIGILLGCFGK